MKAIGIRTTAAIFVLLGMSCPVFAGQDRQGEKQNRPQQKESQHQPAISQAQRGQQQPQQHARQQLSQAQIQPQQHLGQQPNQNRQSDHSQGQRTSAPHQQPQERQRAWQDHRAVNWQSDHRSWQQRGGYAGFRIPESRFNGHFGSNHVFRIGALPFLVVGGYPRFQYRGYWFSMVDPWPGDWANDWYDTDDVYVNIQDNGYYLFDRRHPGIGIAISVSM